MNLRARSFFTYPSPLQAVFPNPAYMGLQVLKLERILIIRFLSHDNSERAPWKKSCTSSFASMTN
jgi:hypothetical protein